MKIISVETKGVHFKVIQDDSCALVCPEIHVIFFNLTELAAKNAEMFSKEKAKSLLARSLAPATLAFFFVITSQATSGDCSLLSSLIFTDAP